MNIIKMSDINLKNDDLIIDIRGDEKYNAKHLKINHIHASLDSFSDNTIEKLKNVKGNIYILCGTGNKALNLQQILKNYDIHNTYVIKGGIDGVDASLLEEF